MTLVTDAFRNVLVLLGVVAAFVVFSGRGETHGKYNHSDPASGSTLSTTPAQVKVWFTEVLMPAGSSLSVWDSAGHQVDTKDSKVYRMTWPLEQGDAIEETFMTVSLNEGLGNGAYNVKWVSVSAEDGDKADGDFLFTVGTQPATVLTSPAQASTLAGLTVTLDWTSASGATQYEVQVAPFENDGPAVDQIQSAARSLTIPAPPTVYLLLPAMTYTWRVRSTNKATAATIDDPSWGALVRDPDLHHANNHQRWIDGGSAEEWDYASGEWSDNAAVVQHRPCHLLLGGSSQPGLTVHR